ncbi:MAG: uroporphyrinogen-III C-methyltransferase [Coxiella sp. RIFCSPHIGHO2_12_FULL_44_14]|nr:MAG: uroporphyrinogen-III C-methyltransferase [Coxiella sp. RIFCSPHIGHO2_12_FULL_44_14]
MGTLENNLYSDELVNPAFRGGDFPEFKPGSVWISGAGPGDKGLLTLLTCHALKYCDVILYDALVNTDILELAPSTATREFVGKRKGYTPVSQIEICQKLVDYAKQGLRVLRLKGGDPFMFGRGAEECLFLVEHSVPFRVVPSVTSGIGGLAYAGIPVTHRGINKSVIFLTGHDSTGDLPKDMDWDAISRASPVLVLFMAIRKIHKIASLLIENNRNGNEPVAIVYNASMPDQQVCVTTLAELCNEEKNQQYKTPSLVVIGEVVELTGSISWFDKCETSV